MNLFDEMKKLGLMDNENKNVKKVQTKIGSPGAKKRRKKHKVERQNRKRNRNFKKR